MRSAFLIPPLMIHYFHSCHLIPFISNVYLYNSSTFFNSLYLSGFQIMNAKMIMTVVLKLISKKVQVSVNLMIQKRGGS